MTGDLAALAAAWEAAHAAAEAAAEAGHCSECGRGPGSGNLLDLDRAAEAAAEAVVHYALDHPDEDPADWPVAAALAIGSAAYLVWEECVARGWATATEDRAHGCTDYDLTAAGLASGVHRVITWAYEIAGAERWVM